MADALAPVSTAAAVAQHRTACPQHGLLEGGVVSCDCGRSAYDLDDEDSRSLLRSLRDVHRSQRMNRARLIGFPLAFLGFCIVFLGWGPMTWICAALTGEPLSRAVERLLRRVQPAPRRHLDAELLQD